MCCLDLMRMDVDSLGVHGGEQRERHMNAEQRKVQDFHEVFDILVGETPGIPDTVTQGLRLSLIQEELDELREGFETNDIVEVADAIADLLYVTYGTAVSCGIDIAEVFEEVHRSNMTKVGGHKREDGKWVKPPHYSPARIREILDAQLEKGET